MRPITSSLSDSTMLARLYVQLSSRYHPLFLSAPLCHLPSCIRTCQSPQLMAVTHIFLCSLPVPSFDHLDTTGKNQVYLLGSAWIATREDCSHRGIEQYVNNAHSSQSSNASISRLTFQGRTTAKPIMKMEGKGGQDGVF